MKTEVAIEQERQWVEIHRERDTWRSLAITAIMAAAGLALLLFFFGLGQMISGG